MRAAESRTPDMVRPWPDLKSVKKATFEWIEMYYNRLYTVDGGLVGVPS